MIFFGENHFNYLVSEYVDYYLTVRFYERMIPLADDLYDLHLKTLQDEDLI